ncbi:pyridoxal-phosphate dependent enzyme [Polaromonas sp. P2-4]|nr:pyridoxal-phosphate dependent enzyme [Polaromonas sp. P2-4]
MLTLPTFDDVIAAAQRLDGHAHRTPVLRSRTADDRLKASVFFKCENFQRMGAFKFRGAFNALSLQRRAAQGRGHHLLIRQPCAGRGPVGPPAGHSRGDPDAAGRAARQGGRHPGLWRRSYFV